MTVLGYARVSTDGQSLDAQVRELKAAGAERVFREKVGGAMTERAQLRKAFGLNGNRRCPLGHPT